MEFAVIKTGGKQYKVSVGDIIRVEKIKGDFSKGDTITFDQVMLSDNGKETKLGTPFIDGGKVTGIFEKVGRAKKVLVVKYKQKSRYLKRNGHRQPFSEVKINSLA